MNPHQIGAQLRAQVLRDLRNGSPVDPRRMQALVADLCGDEQQDLIAPLRYLVLSGTFSTACSMDPPLTDGHLQVLSRELAEVFAHTLCTRIQPVLEGLLGIDATTTTTQGFAMNPEPVATKAASGIAAGVVASASDKIGGKVTTNAVLAFFSGVLLMTLAGVGLLVWQRQHSLVPVAPNSRVTPTPGASVSATDPAVSRPMAGQPEPPSESPSGLGAASGKDRALRSIQELYAALSAKDFETSRLLYGMGAADQFSPGFYSQFKRVTAQNLRVISQTGATLNLEGEVTFVWPDGSVQSETRSFSVDTGSQPALITASEFGRVLTPRR